MLCAVVTIFCPCARLISLRYTSDAKKATCGIVTSSNGSIFRVTVHLCAEFTGPRLIPRTKPGTRIFAVFFDLRLNKRLGKQSWDWWFETLWRPLRCHCNVNLDRHPVQGTSLLIDICNILGFQKQPSSAQNYVTICFDDAPIQES